MSVQSKGFNIDSTGVRFGHFFWLIGGESRCNEDQVGVFDANSKGKKNKNSYIWSTKKKKWFPGPEYHRQTKYIFHYSCAVPLNVSAILFVGLQKLLNGNDDGLANEEFFRLNDYAERQENLS